MGHIAHAAGGRSGMDAVCGSLPERGDGAVIRNNHVVGGKEFIECSLALLCCANYLEVLCCIVLLALVVLLVGPIMQRIVIACIIHAYVVICTYTVLCTASGAQPERASMLMLSASARPSFPCSGRSR